MNNQEYQHLIRISDKVLAAILVQKGVEAVECYQQPPFFRMTYLFSDGRKARRIIRLYGTGNLPMKVAKCAEILDELLFEEIDRQQWVKHCAEALNEK